MTPRPGLTGLLAVGFLLSANPLASPTAEAAPPGAGAKAAGQCFYTSNIENYAVVNDRLLYLRVGVADVYRLDLMTDCPELSFRYDSIEITHSGASSLVCSPIDLTVRFRQIGARRVCPVGEMRRLTPAEVAALPKGERP